MKREKIIEQLSEDILAYVMSGKISEAAFAKSLKPDGLDNRFHDYELLLDLHFVLKPDVIDFIDALPDRLRQIRTETENVQQTQRGGVNGRIDWQQTFKTRSSKSPLDRSLFVVENRSVDYDIPENIVLKRLISRIHTTLVSAEDYLDANYDWVAETWKGDESLLDELSNIVERNVHVSRIRSPETYEPTERMLIKARQSRQPIYREAAKLLQERQQLHSGEQEAIRELLTKTAVTPERDDRVFELYVLFRVVSALDTILDNRISVGTISSEREAIVRLRNEIKLDLYFDRSGSDDLQFNVGPSNPEIANSRFEDVHSRADAITDTYLKSPKSSRTGRPDLLLRIVPPGQAEPEYLIFEVKNSANEKTINRGVKETLEYLAFFTEGSEYIFDSDNYYGDDIHGILIIQDATKDTLKPSEQSDLPIRIFQASELDKCLKTFFGSRFGSLN